MYEALHTLCLLLLKLRKHTGLPLQSMAKAIVKTSSHYVVKLNVH